MKRVLFIFGTRPEAIKLAPLIREVAQYRDMQPMVCVTGQHREILDQVLEVFEITPDWDLNVMTAGQDLFDLTSRISLGLRDVLTEANPDMVVIQGDTTTALMGALSAYYRQIPIAHVEAGLRTGDKYNPFPEEANRAMVDAITDLYFVPTETARMNLLREGVPVERIYLTGNTVIDSVMWASDQLQNKQNSSPGRAMTGDVIPEALRDLYSMPTNRKMILVTGHRRESFGDDFEAICLALRTVASSHDDVDLAYPVHLNPNVRDPVFRLLGDIDRIHLFDPPPYLGFVWLLSKCHFVLTDSGGVQEEAPALDKPVLVMRRVTERPEGVDAGCAEVVGVGTDDIVQACERLLTDTAVYDRMSKAANPYGDGTASRQTAEVISGYLAGNE